jgi:hypothetical protein
MTSEMKTYIDRASGVEVTQLTDHRGHSHHFYFTNPGWYAQGRKLLFASDRNNRTNLFGVDLVTGDPCEPSGRDGPWLRRCASKRGTVRTNARSGRNLHAMTAYCPTCPVPNVAIFVSTRR